MATSASGTNVSTTARVSAASDDMRQSGIPLERVKVTIRDIISSFDKDVLPSDYRRDVFDRIIESQADRPKAEWTLWADLHGTLMTWGCHSRQCWDVLNAIQSPVARAHLFAEKLRRGFKDHRDQYDQSQTLPRSARTARVAEICRDYRHLDRAAVADVGQRDEHHAGTALVLINALRDVCRRSANLAPHSGRAEELSLYHCLIHRSAPSAFVIEALEKIQACAPNTLADPTIRALLQEIRGLLTANNAPADYRSRLSRL